MGSSFQYMDRLLGHLCSNIIYYLGCPESHVRFIGSTYRNKRISIFEQKYFSNRTGIPHTKLSFYKLKNILDTWITESGRKIMKFCLEKMFACDIELRNTDIQTNR